MEEQIRIKISAMEVSYCLFETSLTHETPMDQVEKVALKNMKKKEEELNLVRASFYTAALETAGSYLPLLLIIKSPFGAWRDMKPDKELGLFNYTFRDFEKTATQCTERGFPIFNSARYRVRATNVHPNKYSKTGFDNKRLIRAYEIVTKKYNIDLSEIKKLATMLYDAFYKGILEKEKFNKMMGMPHSTDPMDIKNQTYDKIAYAGVGDLFMLKYRIRKVLANPDEIIAACDVVLKKYPVLANITTIYGNELGFRLELMDMIDANTARSFLSMLCGSLKVTLWESVYSIAIQTKTKELAQVNFGETFDKWMKAVDAVSKIRNRILRRLKYWENRGFSGYANFIYTDTSQIDYVADLSAHDAAKDNLNLKRAEALRDRTHDLLTEKYSKLRDAATIAEKHTFYPKSLSEVKNKKYVDIVLISSAVSILVPSELSLSLDDRPLLSKIIEVCPDICKFWAREQIEASIRRGVLFMKPTGFKFCNDVGAIVFMKSLPKSKFKAVMKDALLVYTGEREEYTSMLKKYNISVTKTDYRKVIRHAFSYGHIMIERIRKMQTGRGEGREARDIKYPPLKKKVVDVTKDKVLKSMPHAKSFSEGDWGINARGNFMVVVNLDGKKRWIKAPKSIMGRAYADLGRRHHCALKYAKPSETPINTKGLKGFPTASRYNVGSWGVINGRKKIVAYTSKGNKKWVKYPTTPNFWKSK